MTFTQQLVINVRQEVVPEISVKCLPPYEHKGEAEKASAKPFREDSFNMSLMSGPRPWGPWSLAGPVAGSKNQRHHT